MGRARRPGRILSPDEQALWDAVTVELPRLQDPRRAGARVAPAVAVPPAIAPVFAPPRAARVPAAVATPVALDRRSAQKLRRGRLAIEGRIDLHGLTQEEAHRTLAGFIAAQVRRGHKYVLVITGKGTFRALRDGHVVSQTGGVLRDQVPKWLAAPALRAHVQAIQPAARHHGGDGAFYVLLRRERRGDA